MGRAVDNVDAVVPARRRFPLFLTVFLAVFLAIILGGLFVKWVYFPSAFSPVNLSQQEQQQLNKKLSYFGVQVDDASTSSDAAASPLQPQAYTENNATREVRFSEKELNSLIAKNPDVASRFALDLSDNLASARILIPVDSDFPLLGGETVRINAGVEIFFANNRPSIKLRGVSLWGVPLPNAWLGNLKNIDLVEQYGDQEGFWKSFSAGIAFVKVADGELVVKLKE
ncbi:hypothetical protein [Neptunomonas antarctica]|uniref:Arginine N-succinyltransferase n=1 Tax=Neptunomonas antarctica TaxID=619304 RepID=A0A1N7P4A6_9GAMM|nr:hypothetical protein [Neptunomonas antarctica]SIT05423.1 hypothetical protein SAMN05421760_112117 [Neptunomonas antarctica]